MNTLKGFLRRSLVALTMLSAFILFSCQNETSTTPLETNSISEKATSFIHRSFPNEDAKLKTIRSEKHDALIISYVTYSYGGKEFNNIALVSGTGTIRLKNKDFPVSNSEGGSIVVSCVGNCSGGTSVCAMKGTASPGSTTIECTCEGCVMKVNQN